MMKKLDALLFDFDGVLVESNDIRTEGFRSLLLGQGFPGEAVDRLIDFHQANGGLSRYVKIRHFFENIMNQQIEDETLNSLCAKFSGIVKEKVIEAPWVPGAWEFLRDHYLKVPCFVVSGSDQSELREICQARGMKKFFKEILGSPENKKTHLRWIIDQYGLDPQKTIFIGDSPNDLEAAQSVRVRFVMRNPRAEKREGAGLVIQDLSELHRVLGL